MSAFEQANPMRNRIYYDTKAISSHDYQELPGAFDIIVWKTITLSKNLLRCSFGYRHAVGAANISPIKWLLSGLLLQNHKCRGKLLLLLQFLVSREGSLKL